MMKARNQFNLFVHRKYNVPVHHNNPYTNAPFELPSDSRPKLVLESMKALEPLPEFLATNPRTEDHNKKVWIHEATTLKAKCKTIKTNIALIIRVNTQNLSEMKHRAFTKVFKTRTTKKCDSTTNTFFPQRWFRREAPREVFNLSYYENLTFSDDDSYGDRYEDCFGPMPKLSLFHFDNIRKRTSERIGDISNAEDKRIEDLYDAYWRRLKCDMPPVVVKTSFATPMEEYQYWYENVKYDSDPDMLFDQACEKLAKLPYFPSNVPTGDPVDSCGNEVTSLYSEIEDSYKGWYGELMSHLAAKRELASKAAVFVDDAGATKEQNSDNLIEVTKVGGNSTSGNVYPYQDGHYHCKFERSMFRKHPYASQRIIQDELSRIRRRPCTDSPSVDHAVRSGAASTTFGAASAISGATTTSDKNMHKVLSLKLNKMEETPVGNVRDDVMNVKGNGQSVNSGAESPNVVDEETLLGSPVSMGPTLVSSQCSMKDGFKGNDEEQIPINVDLTPVEEMIERTQKKMYKLEEGLEELKKAFSAQKELTSSRDPAHNEDIGCGKSSKHALKLGPTPQLGPPTEPGKTPKKPLTILEAMQAIERHRENPHALFAIHAAEQRLYYMTHKFGTPIKYGKAFDIGPQPKLGPPPNLGPPAKRRETFKRGNSHKAGPTPKAGETSKHEVTSKHKGTSRQGQATKHGQVPKHREPTKLQTKSRSTENISKSASDSTLPPKFPFNVTSSEPNAGDITSRKTHEAFQWGSNFLVNEAQFCPAGLSYAVSPTETLVESASTDFDDATRIPTPSLKAKGIPTISPKNLGEMREFNLKPRAAKEEGSVLRELRLAPKKNNTMMSMLGCESLF
ncbi:hypothetical protein PSN45_001984 [Yamadazyma tenuis]|uniref:Uncharacterized protein n=1 Tax=Candida tenuis (strain ATCC 10573 / BCRC 21748 / CBS 615 / JCM 9827 / NBRC 10315 / NRRL Y-1498 / VKM Y-70) TaxID=590646 RepID=G3BD80_CANTC|nr:uncharacterized protein CANTEDRAFT_136748 [Yamadazyma tenuis ATCC 10573]EGV60261.1 hypothetical protein CANTEDRAFT_136748 [Yamadazyma tenuis ATCC 10573]WEJ94497.1 hypothetical protein PSN45_001984 [Yamadazyma tenuis]